MSRQANFILRSRSIPFLLGLALLVPCGTARAQVEFRRGDVDGSGAVNIGDVHPLMAWLFFGESAPTCWDTADADADGAIDLSDVYHILDWLLKGTEIPAPGPLVCGTGTGAGTGCKAYDCNANVTPPSTDLLELGFLLGGQVPGGPAREVLCTLTHSGGDAVVGWSFGVAAEGGRITRVTMEGADVEGVFSEHGRGGFEITHGAGNEGAVSLAVLIATRPVTFPSSSTHSIAKLTVEPSPGAAEVILRYMDGLQGSGQPLSTLVATVKRPVVPRTAPLAIPCSDCSSSGDTHCFQLHVDGPDEGYDENTPGTYSVTARALDDSGDPTFFTFRAERSGAPPLVSGPQSENQAFFDLDEGSWTISVAVDDAHWCSEAAFDATCTGQVVVSLRVAATLVVDLHGTGDFTDIQSAIDAAKDGDVVLVKPGEYVVAEPINFNSDRSLLGRGARNPDDPASPPVKNIEVKSEGGAQVTTIRMAEMPTEPNRASVVVFEHEESGASRLDGFTVTGGRGSRCRTDGPKYLSGGGVMCRDGASPTLSRCTIRGNSAELNGGGVSCCNASPTIMDCTIAENSAESGGGLWVSYSSRPRVLRCLFAANGTMRRHGLVAATGAGLGSDSLELNVEACVFTGNSASEGGGGAAISGAATFVNCVFTGNKAAHGGGFSCSFGRATLLNCTFHGNRATGDGGGILCAIESEVSVTSTVAWGDTAARGKGIAVVDDQHGQAVVNVNTSDVEGGMAAIFAIPSDHVLWGEGNIDADPSFVVSGSWSDGGTPGDPTDDGWIPGDCRLQAGSPCIDAGISLGAPVDDIEGNVRPCGKGVDMGAYERCLPVVPSLAIRSAAGRAGAPAALSPPAAIVVVTEIHYYPGEEQGDAEFIELGNPGEVPVDLAGWRLSSAVDFEFPAGPTSVLPAGQCLVVVEDAEAFTMAFGPLPIAGQYAGKLSNDGELLRLEDAAGIMVEEIDYLGVPPWPSGARGLGESLQLLDPLRPNGDPANWKAGLPTPGRAGFTAPIDGGLPANAWVLLSSPQSVQAFSFGVAHEPSAVRLTGIDFQGCPLMEALNGGAGPDFFEVDLEAGVSGCGNDVAAGGTVACVVSRSEPATSAIPAGSDQAIVRLSYGPVDPSAVSTSLLRIVGCLGDHRPLAVVLTIDFASVTPEVEDGSITIEAPGPRFVRGDANGDSRIDISDAVTILGYLFQGAGPLTCEKAGDARDDGSLDLADAITILLYLFVSAEPLPPPSVCGPDPTPDGLDCAAYKACE